MKSINDAQLKGKVVFLRADLNVPAKGGKISDTTRIDRIKPTIDLLIRKGATIILASHFGRPKGEAVADFSMQFLTKTLSDTFGVAVDFATDCIGEETQKKVQSTKPGTILLLENLRFHAGEEENDKDFAKALSSLADIYVNDAFSVSHRAHASVDAITEFLPSYAGLSLMTEVHALEQVLENPQKPVAAIIGGAKISSKLSLIKNLIPKMDKIIIGGAMANTFFLAADYAIGASLVEKSMTDEAEDIMRIAEENNCEILLPLDVTVTHPSGNGQTQFKNVLIDAVEPQDRILDAGRKSIDMFMSHLETCNTILWNGPLGMFETKPFDTGTNNLARFVADRTGAGKCTSIAGGGDTVSALMNAGAADQFTYLSTAGGAFLEWLEGKELPGITALKVAQSKAA